MKPETLVGQLDDYEWSYPRGSEGRLDVIRWKTLISADRVPTEAMIMGILEVPAGAKMNTHRHTPPEVYYIYDGCGDVFIDGTVHSVRTGSVVFVKSDALHGVRNLHDSTLRLMWMFAGDSFADIEYRGEAAAF